MDPPAGSGRPGRRGGGRPGLTAPARVRSNAGVTYTPCDRGPSPVGVYSLALADPTRQDRSLPTEVWYPAADGYAGQDLTDGSRDAYRLLPGFPAVVQSAVRDAAPRPGRHPLVVFSHGWNGHRRQSTFLCTHHASHGFVVAAPDHTGNTLMDVVTRRRPGDDDDTRPGGRAVIEARPADLMFVIDRLLGGAPRHIGAMGHSYGGWTALVVTGRDARVGAAVALAPAGGPDPLHTSTALLDAMPPDWGRDVPTLVILADRDSVLPLRGMSAVVQRIPATTRVVVLGDTDHFHFVDRAAEVHEFVRGGALPPFDQIAMTMRPMTDLSPEHAVHRALCGLVLAHLDATLRDRAEARRMLRGGLAEALEREGVRATVEDGRTAAPIRR